jgi:hypothetical protein
MRGRVSADDGDEGVVSTDDGGTARGGAVGVHGRWRRHWGGLKAKFGSVTTQGKKKL